MSAAEQIIASHCPTVYLNGDGAECIDCDCGLTFTFASSHAAHVVAKLREAGHEIVQLPKPDVVVANWEGEFGHSQFNNPVASVYASNDGTAGVTMGRESVTELSPDEAHRAGLALLAAAAAARVAEARGQQ